MEKNEYDVVCVGGGGAGVAASVMASRLGAKVALISKEPIGHGNTRISGGGTVNPSLSANDSPDEFLANLIKAGEGLNNPQIAESLAYNAPEAAIIIESFGHAFERTLEGRIKPSSAKPTGGHSVPRTQRSEPNSIGQACRAAAVRYGVRILENTIVTKLLTHNGMIGGLVAFSLFNSKVLTLSAKTIILATGGLGWLYYPNTDNFRSVTGDGHSLALEAGAELIDMDQVQFKLFAFARPRGSTGLFLASGHTIGSESRLINALGEVVLPRGMDRMTRAQLTKALAKQIVEGKTDEYGGLRLDLSPNLRSPEGRALWERIRCSDTYTSVRTKYGEKSYRWEEPLDVCATCHFTMGGVRIDEWGRTNVGGLYAIGEVAGGIHGADRLATVALAELFVFGKRAGEDAVARAKGTAQPIINGAESWEEERRILSLIGRDGGRRPVSLVRELQRQMWNGAGIVRSEESLHGVLAHIKKIREQAKDLKISPIVRYNPELVDSLELYFLLTSAELVARSALHRRESRGAHYRLDYPDRSEREGRTNIVAYRECGRIEVRKEERYG